MDFGLIGVLTLVAGVVTLRRGIETGCALFVVSMLLGSAAALALPGVGTIQPAHLLLGFVVLAAWRDSHVLDGVPAAFRAGQPGFWLLCTWVYGVAGAVFLPRYFAGQFGVNSVSAAQLLQGLNQVPIGPSSGNVTQSIYFTADLVCFAIVAGFASVRSRARLMADVFLAYCVGDVVFALLDLGTSLTGTSDVLDFMRNSTYVIYTDTAVGNMKRIIGSFTEASAFAYATIGVFCVSMRLALANIRPNVSLLVALTAVVLIVFSTSSTGMVALGPAVALLYAGALWRILRHAATARDVAFVSLSPLILLLLVMGIALDPKAVDAIHGILNSLIFEKSLSQSGIDRARFNAEGIRTFFDSSWLGTGIGSVRTSSFVTAALSNLGLPGSLTYLLFIVTAMCQPSTGDAWSDDVRSAARCGMMGLLIAACVSGAMIDLGLAFFALAGLASSRALAAAPALAVPVCAERAFPATFEAAKTA